MRLFWKLLATFAALCIATVAVMALAFTGAYRALFESQLDDRLRTAALSADELLAVRWPEAPGSDVQTLVRRMGQRSDVRFTLIDPKGRVLADSHEADVAAVEAMENHRDRTEFIDAKRGGVGLATRLSPTLGVRYRYVGILVETPSGQPLGVVRTAYPMSQLATQVATLEKWTWALGGAVSAAAIGLAWWLLAGLTRPLRSLAATAEALVTGPNDVRLPVATDATDEIGSLVRALAEARKRLALGQQQLKSTSQTQATVLEGMAESVIAVDRGEHILFANASAGRALGFDVQRSEGATLLEVVRSHELREAVQTALRSRQVSNRELVWRAGGRRTFDVLAAPLPGDPPPGAVLVLRDVTELKRLEQMRQQFIANVSHELKTPLASIKAYAETLLGGARNDPEHCERFLQRIDEQAARLHALIQDMLSLARIEAGQAALQMGAVSAARIVRRALADYEPQAVSAELVLDNQATDDDLKVRADEEALRQILSNLVDNAVKYTPPGGRVTVRCRRDGAAAVIEVVDTGPGIAAEHHERLFERFYRVDRARSRELGGTGLGLSIVKHLCQTMGGSVSVESAPGKGSTFAVRLPLAS